MQTKGKPDPFMGTGPLRTIFESPDGLDEFLENKGYSGVSRLFASAVLDPNITPGRWLRSGYANISNVGAGRLTKDILNRLSPMCASEVVPTIFQRSRNDLLAMDNPSLGREAKRVFRQMTQDAGETAAKLLLGNCVASPIAASRT